MIFKDEKAFSLFPKLLFMASIITVSLLVSYLMLKDVGNIIYWLQPYVIDGAFARQVVVIFFLFLYVVRLFATVFIFLKRKMEWTEMLLVSGLMSLVLFSFAKVGGNNGQPIGSLDYFSMFLYLLGSWINTYSEHTRYVWKKQKKNRGNLYTEGLFKYSMHINYLGDIFLFTGFALITLQFSMLLIPLLMALNFILFSSLFPRLNFRLMVFSMS